MNQLTNKVQLIGILSNEIAVHKMLSNQKYISFTLTTEDITIYKGRKVKELQQHTCTAFGKVAKSILSNKLQIGCNIALEGKLIYRNYTNKDGNTSVLPEISVIGSIIKILS